MIARTSAGSPDHELLRGLRERLAKISGLTRPVRP